jgi:hypothetical protein
LKSLRFAGLPAILTQPFGLISTLPLRKVRPETIRTASPKRLSDRDVPRIDSDGNHRDAQ